MKSKVKIAILLSFFILLSSEILAKPYIRKINYTDGLPTQTIYDLFISDEGYLFLGTDVGLIQFNGNHFKRLPFKGNIANSLNAIQQDESGVIWCMNFSNQIFYLNNDTLVAHKKINDELLKHGLLKSFIVINDALWILTERKLIKYSNNKFEEVFSAQNKNSNYNFIDLKVGENKEIYISDNQSLILVIENEKITKKITINSEQNEFEVIGNKILYSKKNDLKTIEIFEDNIKYIVDYSILPKKTYLNHMVKEKENIWLCTNTGLYQIDYTNKKVLPPIIENVRISDIVRDKEGGKWISSVEKGLYYIPKDGLLINKISDYNLSTIVAGPNNTILVGAGDGSLYHLNLQGEIISHYYFNQTSQIEFIYFDSVSKRIICSHGVVNLEKKIIEENFRIGKNLSPGVNGDYLLCTYNKALLFKPKVFFSNELNLKKSYLNTSQPIRDFRAKTGLWSNIDQCYYIGFSDGLYYYDKSLDEAKEITFNQQPILAADMILDSNGYVYIASTQSGLMKIKNKKVIDVFTDSNFLSGNTCKKVHLINDNIILILNDKGLDIFDIQNKTAQNLSSLMAFNGMGVSDMYSFKNKIYLATNEGLMYFSLKEANKIILPKITNLLATVKNIEIPNNKELPYYSNDIRFQANSIYFQNMGNFEYEYRLLGYDEKWNIQDGNNNTFNYLSLPPGNYTFEIRTIIKGNQSETHSYSFIISKPFWQSIWFIILIFILISLFVYLMVTLYISKVRKKQHVYEKLLKSQMVALRAQMNPHFLFNVLNSIQGLIYSNKKNEASNYLGKFSSLMRSSLEYSDKQIIPLKKEIELIEAYLELETTRFEENFKFAIKKDFDPVFENVRVPSMIIQPHIENAIKHGLLHKKGLKSLVIKFIISSQKLKIEILDNGIGRVASKKINEKRKQHKSFATKAIESRISLLNKFYNSTIQIKIIDIVEDNIPKGTMVEIVLPINNNYEK